MKKKYYVAKSDREIKMGVIILIVLLDILRQLIFEPIFAETRIGNYVNKFRLIAGIIFIILFAGSILKEIIKKDK